MSWPWSGLGLDGPAELPEVRRAYAQRLKTTHPEEDPEGFQRLHDAYQEASRLARQRKRMAPEEPERSAASPAGEPETDYEASPSPAGEAEAASEEAAAPAGEPRPSSPAKEPEDEGAPADWDYDRLFAEGEEEAREARRRYLEELREKNRARYAAREAEQRKRSGDEAAAWASVMAATQALELLRSTGASLAEWTRFLKGPVFWSAKANLDFIFALEDFLEQNPDLPKGVRQAIFSAYGFEKGPGRPEYKQLYRLLNVKKAERWRLRWENSQWRSWPRRRKIATVLGVALLGVMTVIAFWDLIAGAGAAIRTLLPSTRPAWQETALEWLEEDFGREFLSPFEDERYIFAPDDHPQMYFFAYPDDEAERDLEQGALGYVTNYADRMVMAEMQDFARSQDLELGFDSAGDGYQARLGETPGAYLFQCPLIGAGESITQLGELLGELREKDWYQRFSPDFEVFLCYGDLSFYKARSTEEDFDGDYARSVYENKLGPEMCRYIADKTGTASKDMGAEAYVLLERGQVSIDGGDFFWVTGMEKPPSNTPLVHYFLSADGTELFAVPEAVFSSGLDLETMRQGTRTVQMLQELKSHGGVTIWDLSEAAG